jgi:hypothetical protein
MDGADLVAWCGRMPSTCRQTRRNICTTKEILKESYPQKKERICGHADALFKLKKRKAEVLWPSPRKPRLLMRKTMYSSNLNLESELRTALSRILIDVGNTLALNVDEKSTATNAQVLFQKVEPEERLSTQWPRLPPVTEDQLPNFDHVEFRRRYVPQSPASLYVAGSSGLRQMHQTLQVPVFKIGLSQQPDLLVRQNELRTDAYAGLYKDRGRYTLTAGFDDWEMRQCSLGRKVSPNSPLKVQARGLEVTLPQSLSFTSFDKLLHSALRPIALAQWVMSSVGSNHFAALGVDPAVAIRFTEYKFGAAVRHSRANEIYIFRPREDLDRLCAVIERLVYDHVVTQSTPKLST